MAKARDNRKRRRRRRRKGGGARVVLTFLAVLVIIAAMVAALIIFFKIRTVSVVGESRYSAAELVAASQIKDGENMFLFNKFAAKNRIFAGHPYLDEVSIRRRLPDTVEIHITECQPVAVLHAAIVLSEDEEGEIQALARGYFLIDPGGKLLEQLNTSEGQSLPVVEGTSLLRPEVGKYAVFAEDQMQKPLFLVLNTLKDHDILQDIESIDLTETYNISFKYQGRLKVVLGTTEQLDYKLRCVDSVVTDYISDRDTGTLDVSSPNTAAHFIPGEID